MLVTIATINLNNAAGLRRTIHSFAELRNHDDVRFIFQDGASVDESLEVAASFYGQDEIISAPDSGIYDAMNKTLARADTEYIIWINSGDEILPDDWPSLINRLKKTNTDIFIAGIELAEETSDIIKKFKPDIYDIAKGFPHPGTFFRCEFIEALGGYLTKYKIAGDLELILRSARNGAIVGASDIIASRFYLGGASNSKDVLTETWLAHYENHTISWTTFAIHRLKLFLAEHTRLFRSFRHKKLSAIRPEKTLSIFEIGAKE